MLSNVSDATISFAAIWLLIGWAFGLLFAVSIFWRRICRPADGTVRLLRMQIDDDTARLLRQQAIIDDLTAEVGQLYQKLDRMARRFAEVSAETAANLYGRVV
jgi:hypothetical protein